MGNALDFLSKDKEKRKTIKKHEVTKETKVTVCPDATITIYDSNDRNPSANHKQTYGTDIPCINARIKAKRKTKSCGCCENPFKSNRYQMANGRYHYTKFCEACSGVMHVAKRKLVKKLGGWDNYQYYKSLTPMNQITSGDDIVNLREQLEFRIKWELPHKKIQAIVDLAEEKIAYKKAQRESALRDESDFDF